MDQNQRPKVDTIYRPNKRFWQAEYEMLFSPAYLSLSGKSKDILHLLWSLLKWESSGNSDRRGKTKTGRRRCAINNGELFATYETIMKKVGIASRNTVSKSIQQLLDKGFIDLPRPGSGKYRVPNRYAISNRWKLYGKEGFIPAPNNRQRSSAVLARSKRTNKGLFRPEKANSQTAVKQKNNKRQQDQIKIADTDG